MKTGQKPRLFDYDREPLGLLPESMKTTIEVNDQRAIATLHALRRRAAATKEKSGQGPGRMARLLGAFGRLLR